MGRGLFMHAGEEKACQTLAPQTEPSVSINITQSSIGIPFKEPLAVQPLMKRGVVTKYWIQPGRFLALKNVNYDGMNNLDISNGWHWCCWQNSSG